MSCRGLILLLSIPILLFAAQKDNTMVHILTPDQLEAKLSSTHIVDVRSEDKFAAARIPGSVSMAWEEWTLERPSLWNRFFGNPAKWGKALDDPAALQSRLRALGLMAGREIVVVGEPHGWGEEGRAAWNFLFWGASQVALLDGGFSAWQARFPERLERDKAKRPPPGDFVVRLDPARRSGIDEVKNAMKEGRPLLDVRSEKEFDGETVRGQKRGGRMPGARLIPVTKLYRADGTFITAEDLARLLPPRTTGAIAYCVGGVRSALLAMLVEARLGARVANYDGSMWEWASRPELPLER